VELNDARWEAFAAREPYFAVLTAPRYLSATRTADDERAFFESGEILVDSIFQTVDTRLQPRFAPMSVLEYGCGIGRLAIPLARRAGSVVAVDRSPTMLRLARTEAQRRGIDHIEFQLPEELFATPRKFDLMVCNLVLQRMLPSEGLPLLTKLLDFLAPGGVGVIQVPYHAATDRLRTLTRTVRARVPLVNTIANRLLGKPAGEPFVPTYVYSLDAVAQTLEAASISSTHVALGRASGLDSAMLYLQVPHPDAGSTGPEAPQETVDVKDLIARTSLDDLHRTAEEYFSSLTDWEHHLAKPFSKPEEAPPLLMDVVGLLQGLRPTAGATVLEFGAGTGWLSRFLTQLGCHAILLDVSPTALKIARELYARQPVIGDRPEPRFLVFDGHRIDLPDESVDRIVVFHAFHHAANPDELLPEFARVLKPGGIAGFAEPGPLHSRSPLSQFEMRTYGVIENDVDVHGIWRVARGSGFSDIKLAVFHTPPFHVSLREYEDLLAGGVTSARWLESTRGFLRHVRTFFLYKEGAEARDSRSGVGLSATVRAELVSDTDHEGRLLINASVTNTGTARWLPASAPHGGVQLGAHIYDASEKLLTFDAARRRLSDDDRTILPGESVQVRLAVPHLDPGDYVIELDCVAEAVTWFAQAGSQVVRLPFRHP
jgi:SAM-dependent methyltransferase